MPTTVLTANNTHSSISNNIQKNKKVLNKSYTRHTVTRQKKIRTYKIYAILGALSGLKRQKKWFNLMLIPRILCKSFDASPPSIDNHLT